MTPVVRHALDQGKGAARSLYERRRGSQRTQEKALDPMGYLSKSRILHVVGGSDYGGGSKVILNIARGAAAAGAQVDVLTTNPQMSSEAHELGLGVVDLDAIGATVRPIKSTAGLVRLVSYLRRHRYDIIHTHTSRAGAIGRLAAWSAHTPVIIHTVHGFAFHDRSPYWQRLPVAAVERLASTVSDRVITVSLHHRQLAEASRAVPARKLVAIPNGIAIDEPSQKTRLAEARRELLLPSTNVALLCHGRLAPQKGLDYLLEALAILRKSGQLLDRVTVSLVGDGVLADRLRTEVAERGLENTVQLLGFRQDIPQLIEAADVVVLPSLREGLSIALLEAMAHGALVLVSNIPSNVELVRDGENGLTFAVADSAALAAALERTLANLAELRPLGQTARSEIASTYSVERMQDAYNRVYEVELATSRRR
jgi:glycosyltransferase involved in cell wall biosynthesis